MTTIVFFSMIFRFFYLRLRSYQIWKFLAYAYHELWPAGKNDPPLSGPGRVRKSLIVTCIKAFLRFFRGLRVNEHKQTNPKTSLPLYLLSLHGRGLVAEALYSVCVFLTGVDVCMQVFDQDSHHAGVVYGW